MGPGNSSWLSRAPPVMPGISLLSIIVWPFWTTVIHRPTSVISKLCHSSGLRGSSGEGARKPYTPPMWWLGGSSMESVSIWTSYRPRKYTPLLEFGSHLNSTCNLKSSNLGSLINSGPFPGLIKLAPSTVHLVVPVPSILHPVRSFPLNNLAGLPHFGELFGFKAGAFWPVHCQAIPSGPVVVPDRVFPTSIPSKTMSSGLLSSSLGETNVRWPFDNSTLGSSLAFPQRPTIWAFSCPPSLRSSNHEGYSRSGAFSVKSQRPKKAWRDLPEGEDSFL